MLGYHPILAVPLMFEKGKEAKEEEQEGKGKEDRRYLLHSNLHFSLSVYFLK